MKTLVKASLAFVVAATLGYTSVAVAAPTDSTASTGTTASASRTTTSAAPIIIVSTQEQKAKIFVPSSATTAKAWESTCTATSDCTPVKAAKEHSLKVGSTELKGTTYTVSTTKLNELLGSNSTACCTIESATASTPSKNLPQQCSTTCSSSLTSSHV